MQSIHRPSSLRSLVLLCMLPLVACAHRYVEQPLVPSEELARMAGDDPAAATPAGLASTLAALLDGDATPTAYTFCEGDPETGTCVDEDDGLSAYGLGGTALPLLMELTRLTVEDVERVEDSWQMRSRFRSRVNGIPPLCTRAKATVRINEAGSANIEYGSFYCNWALIGNVLTRFDLSIESVDPSTGTLRGYYSLAFNGTGNALGSGYYVAVPTRDETSTD